MMTGRFACVVVGGGLGRAGLGSTFSGALAGTGFTGLEGSLGGRLGFVTGAGSIWRTTGADLTDTSGYFDFGASWVAASFASRSLLVGGSGGRLDGSKAGGNL